MPLKIGQRYNIAGIGNVVIRRSKAKGKKKVAVRESDGKRVNFGAKGYTIQPNRDRGDNYCSRSKNLNKKGFNANTLARLIGIVRVLNHSQPSPNLSNHYLRKSDFFLVYL